MWRAHLRLGGVLAEWKCSRADTVCPVPDEETPTGGGSGAGRAFSVRRYGMYQWGDLFTARQKAGLLAIVRASGSYCTERTEAFLALVLGRCADYGSTGVVWAHQGEFVAHTFGRQALPIVWDFAEAVQLTNSSGSFDGAVGWVAKVVNEIPSLVTSGSIQPADATAHPLPNQVASVWFTDPPYYDAVPYADLADFFLVWLKRALPKHSFLRDPYDPANPLSPKTREAVQDETKLYDGRPKDRAWFEETMGKAFGEGRRVLAEDGVGSVVFAHKRRRVGRHCFRG